MTLLVCELISRPFAEMGICDDWSYIRTAQHLAATGHIVYNGWAAAFIGWQLYVGATMIKLFGFSFTAPRMGVLLISLVTAFLFQRLLVRTGLSETNATFGTLALIVSPLYMVLSVTFMTDIAGLFAIVACLYGCVRAVQASTSSAAIGWIFFAALTNAVCGTARQIAWLGVLVMVPSTLYLLRQKRRVVLAGFLAVLPGVLLIAGVMHWYSHQPYAIVEPLSAIHVTAFVVRWSLIQFFLAALNLPYLLLPVFLLFLSTIPRTGRWLLCGLVILDLLYVAFAYHHRFNWLSYLMPTQFEWVTKDGGPVLGIQGQAPLFLNIWVQVVLTFLALGALLLILSMLARPAPNSAQVLPATKLTRRQLGWLTLPFTAAYVLLLGTRATYLLSDRYSLGLLVVLGIWLLHVFQHRVSPEVPRAAFLLIAAFAVYGIASTHNKFAQSRARIDLVNELSKAGVPDTLVNNGWEYNMDAELRFAPSLNNPRILMAADFYKPAPLLDAGPCPTYAGSQTPHINPIYSVSYDPNACAGPAGVPPVHYSKWLTSTPGALYLVRRTADIPVISSPHVRLP